MSVYSDPALWEEAKAAARKRMGGHSARAMQLAGRLYRAAGGRYVGKRTKAQKSLERWTDQDWTTKSGKPSRQTGERYLPRKVIEKLTPAEYGATTRAKREGTAAGQQFVKQPARIAAKVTRLKGNPTMKKPTAAQLAARARFAEMARSGAFKRKAKRNSAKKTVSQKISQLTREGYPQKQAVAIALSEERAGKVKHNPMPNRVTEMIYQQLGGDRFAMMTGAKNFVAYPDLLQFSIPRNASSANQVRVFYEPSSDLYTLEFLRTKGLKSFGVARFPEVYADQLQPFFTQVTGMYTSLGTMGRKTNPRVSNPATGTKKSRTKLNPATGTKKSRTKLNPMAAHARSPSQSNYKYSVEAKRLIPGGSHFVPVAGFHTKAQAQDYAKAILTSHPGVTLRIKTYAGGPI
jgi:hypothetical protein